MTNDTRTPSVAELEARLDEAKWWFYDHTLLECHCQWHQRIADLESQLDAAMFARADAEKARGEVMDIDEAMGLAQAREQAPTDEPDTSLLHFENSERLRKLREEAAPQPVPTPADGYERAKNELFHLASIADSKRQIMEWLEENKWKKVPASADREEMVRELDKLTCSFCEAGAKRYADGKHYNQTGDPNFGWGCTAIGRAILDLMQAKGWLR